MNFKYIIIKKYLADLFLFKTQGRFFFDNVMSYDYTCMHCACARKINFSKSKIQPQLIVEKGKV